MNKYQDVENDENPIWTKDMASIIRDALDKAVEILKNN